MTSCLLSLLASSLPAQAVLIETPASEGAMSGAEIVSLVTALVLVLVKVVHLLLTHDEAPAAPADGLGRGHHLAGALLGAAGVPVAVRTRQRPTPASVFGTSTPRLAGPDRPDQPDAAAVLARRLVDLSVPQLTELVVALHRRLLVQRVEGGLGPYQALVRPSAAEALLRLAGVQAVHWIEVGPARIVGGSVDDQEAYVDVESFALVQERWQDRDRVRLRRDLLRLQRPLAAAHVPHDQAMAALDVGPDDLLLPADIDGWVVASISSDMILPPSLAALRATDHGDHDEAGRPGRVPAPDLDQALPALQARHPSPSLDQLLDSVRDLAADSLAARAPDGVETPALAAFLRPRTRALHAFWRRAAAVVELPTATLDPAARFRPATSHVVDVQPLRVGRDPWLELLDLAVIVQAAEAPAAGPSQDPPARHTEVWTLGRSLDGDDDWRLVDLSWAPVPIG